MSPKRPHDSRGEADLITDDTGVVSGLAVEGDVINIFQELAAVDPTQVQEIAAKQIQLLSIYYEEVVSQSQRSFKTALWIAVLGFVFILAAVVFYLVVQPNEGATWIAVVSGLAGLLAEFIAAINFWLYSKATEQLADFRNTLDRTQRHLLANSVCEGLDNEHKQIARSQLVAQIAGITAPVKLPEVEIA